MNCGQRFVKQSQTISSEAWKCIPIGKLFPQTQFSVHRGQTPPLNYRDIFQPDSHPVLLLLALCPFLYSSPSSVAGVRDLFIKLSFPSFIWADLTVLLASLFFSRDLELVTQVGELVVSGGAPSLVGAEVIIKAKTT